MYGHPYTPYDVQKRFMTDLYETLSTKKIGLFESPTGTGKTLSLLCPTVSWLRDSAERQLKTDLQAIEDAGGPQWLIKSAKDRRIAEFESLKTAHLELVDVARKTQAELDRAEPNTNKRVRKNLEGNSINEFLLEDEDVLGTTTLELINRVKGGDDEVDDVLAPLKTTTKLFFASRTHSQLSQVADALHMLKLKDPVRFVALGSRRQLCIHPEVTALSSVNNMNEKCADLQKHGKCSYRHKTRELRNQALGQIMDIEDLAKYGKAHGSCPYYAAREAVPYAEVVALPYPMLLSLRNRTALGIDLSDSVVIVDEAHNLIDTVTSLHSASLSASVVNRALNGLNIYHNKLGSRLSTNNRRRVHQVILLVNCLAHYFAKLTGPVKSGSPITASDLFATGNIDTLNISELNEFVRASKLVFKVDSYLQALKRSQTGDAITIATNTTTQEQSSLGTVMDFVVIATDPMSEGKLFHDVGEDSQVYIRYLVLDASYVFKDVVEDAHTVIMAGGTMEPVNEFTDYLVPYINAQDVAKRSYGHIVPKSQLLVMPLSTLKFTFATRNNDNVIARLGELLLRIVSVVPNGVVAFFPGYKYLSHVLGVWQKTGMLQQIQKKKRIFAETNESTDIFTKYSGHATSSSGTGALLLAVVGGKLSEGINFSDALARAVVMVGIPFPNAFSAEMVAKRGYIEQQASKIQKKSRQEAIEAARQYYENLAMRAVNQSVGRAIRHAKDYAAIFLIDERYKSANIKSKLSKWVRDSVEDESTNFEERAKEFFTENKL